MTTSIPRVFSSPEARQITWSANSKWIHGLLKLSLDDAATILMSFQRSDICLFFLEQVARKLVIIYIKPGGNGFNVIYDKIDYDYFSDHFFISRDHSTHKNVESILKSYSIQEIRQDLIEKLLDVLDELKNPLWYVESEEDALDKLQKYENSFFVCKILEDEKPPYFKVIYKKGSAIFEEKITLTPEGVGVLNAEYKIQTIYLSFREFLRFYGIPVSIFRTFYCP